MNVDAKSGSVSAVDAVGEIAIHQRPIELLQRTHGFLPMQLPEEMRFTELVHAEEERIPIDALDLGTRAIQRMFEPIDRAPQ
jgi:hypothetical protein